MYVINKEIYGFLPRPYNYQTVEDAVIAFNSFKVDALGECHCEPQHLLLRLKNSLFIKKCA